jgi:C-terminal processing protease CtpA/Prc
LDVLKDDNAYISVVKGQAQALGVRTGDVIVRVDGTKVSPEMVSHLLKALGRPLQLTVRRTAIETEGHDEEEEQQQQQQHELASTAMVSDGGAKPDLSRSGSGRMGSYQM